MTPSSLLAEARSLLDGDLTGGLRARAAVLLTRQALEGAVEHAVSLELPFEGRAPFGVALLCLRALRPDDPMARRVAATWSGLSRASHAHGYELAPRQDVVRAWIAEVEQLIASTAPLVAPEAPAQMSLW